MTIALTFHLWHLIPVALVVLGLWVGSRSEGPMDFVSPLIGCGFIVGAVLLCLGVWIGAR